MARGAACPGAEVTMCVQGEAEALTGHMRLREVLTGHMRLRAGCKESLDQSWVMIDLVPRQMRDPAHLSGSRYRGHTRTSASRPESEKRESNRV